MFQKIAHLKYKILNKSKKFYFTPRKIIWIAFATFLLPIFVKWNILNSSGDDFNVFDLICFLGIFATMILGLAFSLFRVNKVQYLEGKLNGELEFKLEEILINNQSYPLSNISHIKLDAKDFKGYWNLFSFEGNFGDSYQSNGTKNSLELTLNNNEEVKVNFQQLYKNQIHSEKEILNHYCQNGKLNYASLKDLLEYK